MSNNSFTFLIIDDQFRSEVLILSTNNDATVPTITNAAGDVDRDFYFSIDNDAEVSRSCSIVWNNQLYIFGGKSMKTQISKVTNCRLERVGELAFNHAFGACTNVADDRIYLCFDEKNAKKCRVGSSPMGSFTEITSSHNAHKWTRIATNNGELNFQRVKY